MGNFLKKIFYPCLVIGLSVANPAPAYCDQGNDSNSSAEFLNLSLHDTVENTLKNNVDILVQEYFSKIRDQNIIDEKSAFDPLLSAELSADERQSQVSSAFASPDINRNDSKTWNLKLNQKLVTGMDYELSFNNRRNKNNSLFSGLNPQYSSELELTLTQPLLKNFGIGINKTEISIASNNRKISDFEFKGKVIQTLAAVENLYWDLVFSIEDLRVKEKSLARARDLERRVKAQVDVGTMAPLEILQAQSEVASREQLLLSARNLIKDTEDNLKNFMNIGFSTPDGQKTIAPLDRPRFSDREEMDMEKALKMAFNNRPEYLARKKDLKNKNIRVKFNANQLYPSVDLFGSLGLNGLSGRAVSIRNFDGTTSRSRFDGDYTKSLSALGNSNFFQWRVGVQLSYPLGNRSARSQLESSRLEVRQTLQDIKNLENKIVVEVREALRQIKTDIKRVQATRIARRLAEEKLKAEEKKFAVGMSTSFNILEFQEDLAGEQSNEIRAIIDYNKSKNKLDQVLANTLERHNIKLSTSPVS